MSYCDNCGLTYQCVCADVPKLNSDILLSLLMHENEYQRETNTGKWLKKSLPLCQDYPWSRVEANLALLERINNPDNLSFVIYPGEESIPLDEAISEAKEKGKQPHYIVLDGTWQEAKKMERKSPWLDGIQRVHLSPQQLSNYQLRRNQSQGNLCTLEVASEILKDSGEETSAKLLTQFLTDFSKIFQADKSGHVYSSEH